MTEPPSLIESTGSDHADRILRGVISAIELSFPRQVHSYYLTGSAIDKSMTVLSDIDLLVVFRDKFAESERQRFRALITASRYMSLRDLDINTIDESTLLHADQMTFQPDPRPAINTVALKTGSTLVYGTDIRDQAAQVPHEVLTRTLMHFPFQILSTQRNFPARLSYPLNYPDPQDEFYGYTGRRTHAADGTLIPSTKRLTHISGYIALALLALRTPLYIVNKRMAVMAYRHHIDDGWADHLESTHHYCRAQWGFRVPDMPHDRQLLRNLCIRELAFENYFMGVYKTYLGQELAAPDAQARRFAQERLNQIE